MNTGKQALVIIGMHRSGTSATTGALQCLGVQLGKRLYAGHVGINDKGYFEHSDIADTNDEVLWKMGSSWDDVLLKPERWWENRGLEPYKEKMKSFIRRDFSGSELWAVKDPRVCRLLPWWLTIFEDENITPYFLFVIRKAEEVYRSLEKRDGFSKDKALLLWFLHYIEAEKYSRNYPRAFLSFDEFLHDPTGELQRVESTLGIKFPVSIPEATACLSQFLSAKLRHHESKPGADDNSNELYGMVAKFEAELLKAASVGGSALNSNKMDWLAEEIISFQQRHFYGPLVEHIQSIGKSRGDAQITLNKIFRSWSWCTGKPIRFLERSLFKRDV